MGGIAFLLHFVADVHAHVGDCHVLSLLLLHVAAARQRKEQRGSDWGKVLVVD